MFVTLTFEVCSTLANPHSRNRLNIEQSLNSVFCKSTMFGNVFVDMITFSLFVCVQSVLC